jgi:iron complex transport system substrate-binding protein
MSKFNKIFAAVLSIVLLSSMFVGCAGGKTTTVTKTATNTVTNTKTETVTVTGDTTTSTKPDEPEVKPLVYPYTVQDQAGRTVTINKKYERVAFSSVRPLPATYFAVTGNIDTLVGMNPSSRSAALASMFVILCPEIANVPTNFIVNNDTNIEELMKLNPEVVFCLNKNTDEINALEAAGITAVGLETNGTDPIELFAAWADLIGQVMGEQNRAKAIIEESRKAAQEVKDIAKTITDKKKVMFLYRDEGGTLQVAGSNLYSQYWIETIGAENVAKDCNNVTEVSMEQIMQWNPEYIFITTFTKCQPDDLYNNKIEGQDWSGIKAVQDGHVYKDPLGIYRWFTPTSDSALMLKWIASKTYPEYYKYDMEKEVRDYYKTFYGYELSDKELNMVFNPSSDAAYYVK